MSLYQLTYSNERLNIRSGIRVPSRDIFCLQKLCIPVQDRNELQLRPPLQVRNHIPIPSIAIGKNQV